MPNALFESLRPELEEWVGWHRVPRVGPLDIKATAKRLGMPVYIGPLASTYGFLSLEGDTYINSVYPDHWRVTFGHEYGHHLVRTQLAQYRPLEYEEEFCEQLGRELAVPSSWLRTVRLADVQAVARAMKVDVGTAFFQLWSVGLGPQVLVTDDQVLCAICGDPEAEWKKDCACVEPYFQLRARIKASKK